MSPSGEDTVRQMRTGAPGQLTTGDGRTLPVTVGNALVGAFAEDGGGDILLVLLEDPGELPQDGSEGSTLESATTRGLVRFRGTATRVGNDMLRFFVDGAPEVVQRRQFVRVTTAQRVELDDALGHVTGGHAVNVSGGGMLVTGQIALDLDAHISFRLHLSDDEPPIAGLGRVLRAGDGRGSAIVFEQITQTDRDRLIHFIFDRQRAALRLTRRDAI